MLGFRVVKQGLFSTFQDFGRLGYQDQGMPISGAMDQESMIIANKLVGKKDDAVLEMTFTGDTIEFLKPMSIAITGANMTPLLNNKPISMYRTITVKQGDTLSFNGLKTGFRSYVAFSDEIVLEKLFDSKSTYTKIESGGYKGRQLKNGDCIEVEERPFNSFYNTVKPQREDVIRVILSYEFDHFKNTDILFSTPYSVCNELDRMGVRLEGNVLEHKISADIISSPIIPGAIQIPKSGKPMIMLRDAQTIGGYTRIGAVISCDLDKLAQKKPGDTIIFRHVTLEEATKIKKEWLRQIDDLNILDDRKTYQVKVNGISYDVIVEEL
jgi:biotin-dependent carboxylase-like uncharacterized protein